MAPETRHCPQCDEVLTAEDTVCPTCGTPVVGVQDAAPAAPEPREEPRRKPSYRVAGPSGSGTDVTRRVARLARLNEAAEPLGITLPTLPDWAEEFARSTSDPERWNEVVRGVEKLAQQRVVEALEEWEKAVKNRLARLEAYSVDGRLERDQIEDILHAARGGDLSLGLATYQQVDRVVTLKERHLDQAREELERLVSLLRDMEALGLPTPQNPAELSDDLERELRGGHLATLKQQMRAIRTQTVSRLRTGLPGYVTQYGDFLVRERDEGVSVELEAAELARGARDFSAGKPEEALRRLRVLAQVHGGPTSRPSSGGRPKSPSPPADPEKARGASRTA